MWLRTRRSTLCWARPWGELASSCPSCPYSYSRGPGWIVGWARPVAVVVVVVAVVAVVAVLLLLLLLVVVVVVGRVRRVRGARKPRGRR